MLHLVPIFLGALACWGCYSDLDKEDEEQAADDKEDEKQAADVRQLAAEENIVGNVGDDQKC